MWAVLLGAPERHHHDRSAAVTSGQVRSPRRFTRGSPTSGADRGWRRPPRRGSPRSCGVALCSTSAPVSAGCGRGPRRPPAAARVGSEAASGPDVTDRRCARRPTADAGTTTSTGVRSAARIADERGPAQRRDRALDRDDGGCGDLDDLGPSVAEPAGATDRRAGRRASPRSDVSPSAWARRDRGPRTPGRPRIPGRGCGRRTRRRRPPSSTAANAAPTTDDSIGRVEVDAHEPDRTRGAEVPQHRRRAGGPSGHELDRAAPRLGEAAARPRPRPDRPPTRHAVRASVCDVTGQRIDLGPGVDPLHAGRRVAGRWSGRSSSRALNSGGTRRRARPRGRSR